MTDLREYWNFNDPAASRGRFVELLDTLDDRSLKFEVECQIARTHSLQRSFDEAHKILDRLAEALPTVNDRSKASYRLERGRTYNSSGDKARAAEEFMKAAMTQEDDLKVDAYHMLAICAPDPESAEEWNLKALELSGSSEDFRAKRWRASLLNNLGWTYHDSGRYADALPLFEEAIGLRLASRDAESHRVARWAHARCLRSLERYEEALAIQEDLVKGPKDGYVHEELAELLLILGRAEESRPHFLRAHEMLILDQWMAANEGDRLDRLRTLAG